jgi:hypothetical protein
MSENAAVPQNVPVKALLFVFAFVFLFFMVLNLVEMSNDAPVYEAIVRIQWIAGTTNSGDAQIRDEARILQSDVILTKVISDLGLNKDWGHKIGFGDFVPARRALRLLRSELSVHFSRKMSTISISVCDEDPDKAAGIANSIVDNYREWTSSTAGHGRVYVLESASPPSQPVPWDFFVRVALPIIRSLVYASAAGSIAFGLASRAMRKAARMPPPLPDRQIP